MEGGRKSKTPFPQITPLFICSWRDMCLWNRQNFKWKIKHGQKFGGGGVKNGKNANTHHCQLPCLFLVRECNGGLFLCFWLGIGVPNHLEYIVIGKLRWREMK